MLDGMTPETFGTSIRGTACGTSAALSRLYVTLQAYREVTDIVELV